MCEHLLADHAAYHADALKRLPAADAVLLVKGRGDDLLQRWHHMSVVRLEQLFKNFSKRCYPCEATFLHSTGLPLMQALKHGHEQLVGKWLKFWNVQTLVAQSREGVNGVGCHANVHILDA